MTSPPGSPPSDARPEDRAAWCSNCGARLHGTYCHRCGQETRERIAPLWTMAKDLLGELFNLDTRLIRTLRRLLFQPGRLTVEYIAGRRAGYVPPLRLFIFSSFILLLLLSVLNTQTVTIEGSASGALDSLVTQEGRQASAADARPVGDSTAQIDVVANDPIQMSQDAVRSMEMKVDSLRSVQTIRGQFHYALLRGILRADRSPQLFMRQLIGRLSGLTFLLVPVFALLLKGLYVRSGRLYMEHLIFALHTHAVFFLGLIGIVLIALLGVSASLGYLQGALFWGAGLYLLLALRRTYQQGWITTAAKWAALLIAYLVLITVAMVIYTLFTFILL